MDSKFQYYEVVRVVADSNIPKSLHNVDCVVVGKSASKDEWFYTLKFSGDDNTWMANEQCLVSTGKHVQREDVFSGDTVTVTVDKKTGRASLK